MPSEPRPDQGEVHVLPPAGSTFLVRDVGPSASGKQPGHWRTLLWPGETRPSSRRRGAMPVRGSFFLWGECVDAPREVHFPVGAVSPPSRGEASLLRERGIPAPPTGTACAGDLGLSLGRMRRTRAGASCNKRMGASLPRARCVDPVDDRGHAQAGCSLPRGGMQFRASRGPFCVFGGAGRGGGRADRSMVRSLAQQSQSTETRARLPANSRVPTPVSRG
jgi:hypothetical protein